MSQRSDFETAIAKDDAALAQELLKKAPALLQARHDNGASPLHLAAKHDAANVASALLRAGADFYARDINGQLALDIPPGGTLNATRRALREINQSRNEFLGTVGRHDAARAKELLASDPSLAGARDIGDGWSAVMMACHFGDTATLQALLDAKAPLDATDFHTGHDALTACVLAGKTDCLRLLLDAGVDVTRTWRVGYGSLPMQMNALHIASWKGHTEIVKLLLDTKKFDVNTRAASYAMFSPLHFAATEGHADIIVLLLAAGADRNAIDGRRGINALQMAQAGKHEAAVAALSAK